MRAWEYFGCHAQPETGACEFRVWAPHARQVSVAGDFNGWQCEATPMEPGPGGVWAAEVRGLSDGDSYKYYVAGADGSRVFKADPFAFHSETRPGTASKVWNLGGYEWSDAAYMAARAQKNVAEEPVSIYEVHAGSWRKKEWYKFANIREIADELSEYACEMGYTHVQLMPFLEYPLDESWGYQATGNFAVTSRYGTPQDYMYFVDRMHGRGVGVIADWVCAHFPGDGHGLARFDGTWLYERENPELRVSAHGTFHYDYSKPEVADFLLSSAMFLLGCYHIDGLCVGAADAMLFPGGRAGGAEPSAVAFLQKLNDTVTNEYPGCIMAAEAASRFPGVTARTDEGGLGFTFKWDGSFAADALAYMETPPQARPALQEKLAVPSGGEGEERYILPLSHEEAAGGRRSLLEKMVGDYGQKFASLRLLYGYQFAYRGKKLMFMGGEFGQAVEWCEQKGLDWFLLDYPQHMGIQNYVAALNRLYGAHRALHAADGLEWVCRDDETQVYVMLRRAGDSHMLAAFNCMPAMRESYYVELPGQGLLQRVLCSDEKQYGGTGVFLRSELHTKQNPGRGHKSGVELDLPPLSALFYELIPE